MRKKKHKLTKKEQKVEDWFEVPMLVVTVLLIVTLLVPLLFDLSKELTATFAFLNLAIWSTFYIELFTKLYVAKSKLEGIKRNWILIIIAIAPLFISLRLIRVSRLISVVRLFNLQNYVAKLKRGVREFIYNVEYILISIVVFVVTSGFLMWQIETRFDGSITTLPDALWWAVITITTIGYGDMVPASTEGKLLGAVIGLFGTVLFMVFVARVTSMFVEDKNKEVARKKA